MKTVYKKLWTFINENYEDYWALLVQACSIVTGWEAYFTVYSVCTIVKKKLQYSQAKAENRGHKHH